MKREEAVNRGLTGRLGVEEISCLKELLVDPLSLVEEGSWEDSLIPRLVRQGVLLEL